MDVVERSQWIKREAAALDFLDCGIAEATFLDDKAPLLLRWLAEQRHGEMTYMSRNIEKRLDPRKLVPGARSVISVLFNYYPQQDLFRDQSVKIAKYAYGTDYHKVVKDRLHLLLNRIRTVMGEVQGRVFVDSAPVEERAWAQRAGIGWIGRNTLLLNKKAGSYFFLGEIICDLPLAYDQPVASHCGSCTACVDACPTHALSVDGTIDARRCISYLTIELKDDIPKEVPDERLKGWVFGCDICQEVCPWNRFAKPHTEPAFEPLSALHRLTQAQVLLTEENFNKYFAHSPLKRAGYTKLKRTLRKVKRQTSTHRKA